MGEGRGQPRDARLRPGYYSEAFDWHTYRARGVYLPSAVFNASPRSKMPERQRGELEEFYAVHNCSLEAFLGRSMAWSS